MTTLQVSNAKQPTPKAGISAPSKWQEMSRNIKAHDAAIRERRTTRAKKFAAEQGQHKSMAQKASHTIRETFVPVTSVDGRRIMGQSQQVETTLKWQGTSVSLAGEGGGASAQVPEEPELLISFDDSEEEVSEALNESSEDEIDAFTPFRVKEPKIEPEHRVESPQVVTTADQEEDLIQF